MNYSAAARVAAMCTLVLFIPVLILDFWISPATLAVSAPSLYNILITLYLLAGVTFAVFAYGFADLGRRYQSAPLIISSTALAASYLMTVAIAGLVFVMPGLGALDVPMTILRAITGMATGASLLNLSWQTNRSDVLLLLTGSISALDGAFVLLGILQVSLDDVSTIILLAVGYLLFRRETRA